MSAYRPAPAGKISVAVLDQAEVWQDRAGNVVELTAMEPSHRSNVIGYLERHAARLQLGAALRAATIWPAEPSDGVWDAMLDSDAEFERDPIAWLNDKPLVRRLRELNVTAAVAR